MAAVPNTRRYVVEGSMPGGERFAFSWAAVGPAVAGQTAQGAADAMVANAAWTAFLAEAKTYWNSSTVADTLRVYFYGNGGLLADAGVAAITGGAGTGGTAHPNQVALAVSLRTAINNRTGRGRFYIPCNGAAMTAGTGKINKTTLTLATVTAGLMAYCLGQVASETQQISRPVVQVKVGDVPDTIRARRAGLVETYSSANVS